MARSRSIHTEISRITVSCLAQAYWVREWRRCCCYWCWSCRLSLPHLPVLHPAVACSGRESGQEMSSADSVRIATLNVIVRNYGLRLVADNIEMHTDTLLKQCIGTWQTYNTYLTRHVQSEMPFGCKYTWICDPVRPCCAVPSRGRVEAVREEEGALAACSRGLATQLGLECGCGSRCCCGDLLTQRQTERGWECDLWLWERWLR